MAFIELRERARQLRKEGQSIRDISYSLRVSKSTASYWCRDVALSQRQMRKLARRSRAGAAIGRLRAAEVKRASRMEATRLETERGAQSVGTLTRRDLFMLGVALYWGEGNKNGNEECGLTNSSADIMRAYLHWLKGIYAVSRSDLIARVSINAAHKHRLREVERYWSSVTRIPLSQFSKPSLIKTANKKIYSNAKSHFGTLRVKVRRATALRRRILGSIAEIAKQINTD